MCDVRTDSRGFGRRRNDLSIGEFHIHVDDACCLLPMGHGIQVQNQAEELIWASRGTLQRRRFTHFLPLLCPLPGVRGNSRVEASTRLLVITSSYIFFSQRLIPNISFRFE
ncbi:hypothetical protein SASPL_110138 [Salvia splendens]|uniref:Uncharacterized protein n=1 Tax=Salvia splendens TaxID=180675 RepID=A0A8X8Y6R0_SALSN|nr:hypothetical protein SASPL_110138 [Salvia splendens]